MLLSVGLDGDARKAFLNGPAHGGEHLHRLLKFVTMRTERGRDRSGIQAPGGPVDPSVDGDPTAGCAPRPTARMHKACDCDCHSTPFLCSPILNLDPSALHPTGRGSAPRETRNAVNPAGVCPSLGLSRGLLNSINCSMDPLVPQQRMHSWSAMKCPLSTGTADETRSCWAHTSGWRPA